MEIVRKGYTFENINRLSAESVVCVNQMEAFIDAFSVIGGVKGLYVTKSSNDGYKLMALYDDFECVKMSNRRVKTIIKDLLILFEIRVIKEGDRTLHQVYDIKATRLTRSVIEHYNHFDHPHLRPKRDLSSFNDFCLGNSAMSEFKARSYTQEPNAMTWMLCATMIPNYLNIEAGNPYIHIEKAKTIGDSRSSSSDYGQMCSDKSASIFNQLVKLPEISLSFNNRGGVHVIANPSMEYKRIIAKRLTNDFLGVYNKETNSVERITSGQEVVSSEINRAQSGTCTLFQHEFKWEVQAMPSTVIDVGEIDKYPTDEFMEKFNVRIQNYVADRISRYQRGKNHSELFAAFDYDKMVQSYKLAFLSGYSLVADVHTSKNEINSRKNVKNNWRQTLTASRSNLVEHFKQTINR